MELRRDIRLLWDQPQLIADRTTTKKELEACCNLLVMSAWEIVAHKPRFASLL